MQYPIPHFRGRAKPPGILKPGANLPRMLLSTFPFCGPDFTAYAFGNDQADTTRAPIQGSFFPRARGSVVQFRPVVFGSGVQFLSATTGTTNEIGYETTVTKQATFEFIVTFGSSAASQSIFKIGPTADASTAGTTICIQTDASSIFTANWADTSASGQSLSSSFTAAASKTYHVVFTLDGTNTRFYVDGVQTNSGSAGPTLYTGETDFIGFGALNNGGSGLASNVNLQLFNHAAHAWRQNEVAARFQNPWEMFDVSAPTWGDMLASPAAFILPGRPTPSSTTGRSGGAAASNFYSWLNG